MNYIARRVLCAFALLNLAAIGTAAAATYFVNSNGGNDSYSGTMPVASGGTAGPWQTLAKLASTNLAPNDTVYLACGGVWNETLKVPSSGAVNVPITIAAGPGNCAAAPLIDGAVTIPAHQWVQHSGSIYKARLPIDLISNPSPSSNLAGWSQWSASSDASLAPDSACPGQAAPCMVFTSGISTSIAISNTFPVGGGVDYSTSVQLRAAAGSRIKVIIRRSGPTYESLAPDQWITSNGDWQTVTATFRANAAVSNARMDVEVPGSRIRVNLREAHVLRPMPAANLVAAFVDGVQVRRAHHPNFGQGGNANSPYATIASAGGKTTLDIAGLVLPSGASLAPGLGVAMRTTNWSIEERTITAINGTRLTWSAPTNYDTLPGYGFYLTGALWMLDSPGEWFYDAATSTLYAWMPDSTAPANRVSVSGIALGADLTAKANITFKDVSIKHVGTGVALTGSSAVSFSGGAISDTADYGISAENCVACTVQNSSIARTGLDAITVPGALANRFTLTDSTVSDSGASTRTDGWRMLPRMARSAVYSIGPQSTVLRNTIAGAAYTGVYVGPNATVSDNFLWQTCLGLNDCGAIYVNLLGNYATISRNIVETVPGNLAGVPANLQTQAVGIYLDDRNVGSVVSGNTVTGADYGIQLHDASGQTLSNNVLFGNRRYQIWMQEQTRLLRSAGDQFGNVVQANVLVPTASGPSVYLESEISDTVDFSSFAGNHYSALLSPRILGERPPTGGTSYTVAEWLATGREPTVRFTQPAGYASFLAGSSNLVPNGALGSGIAGWTRWNQTAPLATTTLVLCSFGPCLQLNAGASPTLLSSPNFSLTGSQWYRVSFDAATSQEAQTISAVVRRGGGGTAGYEFLMPAAESFTGSTSWRRYAFVFQATKTVTAGDPVTQELGARIDFERNQPGTVLTIARLEMVTLTPAQAALHVKLLLNRTRVPTSMDCASVGVAQPLCGNFVYLSDGSPVNWPVPLAAFSSQPVYTRDTSLTDTDGDGIADQQDACPNTPAGQAVNARGCAFNQ